GITTSPYLPDGSLDLLTHFSVIGCCIKVGQENYGHISIDSIFIIIAGTLINVSALLPFSGMWFSKLRRQRMQDSPSELFNSIMVITNQKRREKIIYANL